MMPLSVEPCFDTVRKISPGRPLGVLADVGEALAIGDPELERAGPLRVRGSFSTDRLVHDLLDDPLHLLRCRSNRLRLGLHRRVVPIGCDRVLLGGRQRLADLAVVAVDRDGLEAELPRQQVQRLDVLDRGFLGHVHRLGDGTGQERLHGAHHPHVTLVVDGVVTHRAGEHGDVLGSEVRRAEDALLGDRCRR